MKCLVVADLHYSLSQFDWLTAVAPKFDLAVIAGDLLDAAATAAPEVQTVVVSKYLKKIQPHAKLLVCSGNHDGDALNSEGERVAQWLRSVRKSELVTDGGRYWADDETLFSLCPWWDGPVTRKELDAQLQEDARLKPSCWVWVHHEPPDERPVSWNGKRFFGDKGLLNSINRYQPDMVLSGHVHQAPFRQGGSWIDQVGKTWVFNTGRQMVSVPSCIVIDFSSRQAEWISTAGRERVDLRKPFRREDVVVLE